jgi:hypothetical protein
MDPANADLSETGEQDPALGRVGFFQFQIVGSISHAAHFVHANWPRESTRPFFDTTTKPMTLSFDLDAKTVRDLQETLLKAIRIEGPLAKSARAFRMLVAARLVGRVIPDSGRVSSHGSRAG